MAVAEKHVLLGPLLLHRTQLATAEATARDMERRTPGLPRVSRAWALRELSLRGYEALERLVRAGELFALRAPSPPRGAPRRDERGGAAEDFVTTPPLSLPATHVSRLKKLVRGARKATGVSVSVAALVRESILLGHEHREAERMRAEEQLLAQLEILRRYGEVPAFAVAHVTVISPYAPPGRSGSDASQWSGPVDLKPRRAAREAQDAPPPEAKGAPPQKATVGAARSRSRPRRKRAAVRRPTAGGGDDGDDDGGDGPGRAGTAHVGAVAGRSATVQRARASQ